MKQNYQFGAGVDPEAVARKIQEDIDRQLKAELERPYHSGTFAGPTQAQKRAVRDALRREEREAKAARPPRVTQQQFLDACPPDDLLGKTFLHYSLTVAIELVDYQVRPVGDATAELLKPGGGRGTLDLPLVLTRAVAVGDRDALRIDPQRPMWLRRVEAGPEQPNNEDRRNLNLHVSALDRYEAPQPVETVKPAQRAVDRIKYSSPTEMQRALAHHSALIGFEDGWRWVLVQPQGAALPLLHVPKEAVVLGERWLELYARLVLGEDVSE